MHKYLTIKELSAKTNISERTLRHYCGNKMIDNVVFKDGTWYIPFNSIVPRKWNKNYLLEALKIEKKNKIKGRIYHKIQVDLTYNSNHIEGSKLTHDQTRYIFEARTIEPSKNQTSNVDDIVETINHFICIDKVIDNAKHSLTESFIKTLHRILKTGTKESLQNWFNVGKYKKLPNEVGSSKTTLPENVSKEMKKLIDSYNKLESHNLEEIIDFHYKFEKIHPFQDGNGRIGRLIILKECLKNNIVPFIIYDEIKQFYYRGLKNWTKQKDYLFDTCLSAQDKMKKQLDYFRIKYKN